MSKSKATGSVNKKVIFDTEMDEKLKLEHISKPELKIEDYMESDELVEKLKTVIEEIFFNS